MVIESDLVTKPITKALEETSVIGAGQDRADFIHEAVALPH